MQDSFPESEHFALENLRQWISKYTGIFYSEEKKSILYFRLRELCMKRNIQTLSELYLQLVNNNGDLNIKVAQAASTTHTYFFRESDVLNYFFDNIIPFFNIKEKIRIWSAASSSGQEAYTVAILLAEYFGLDTLLQNFSILGTDINHSVIKQAENGIFGHENLSEVSENYRKKYFSPIGLNQYKISENLKEVCLFRRLNLTSGNWPFIQKFNVVFCRNVLYYFEKPQQEDVIDNIYNYISPGGFLITSVTESIKWLNLSSSWETVLPGIHKKV